MPGGGVLGARDLRKATSDLGVPSFVRLLVGDV